MSARERSTEIWHDRLALGVGFHEDEASHCWTDGRARVPSDLLQPFTGSFVLEVRLIKSGLRYPKLPPGAARLGKAVPTRRSRDPDLHLIVDGAVLRAQSIVDRTHRFAVPAGARAITIASRSVVPRQSGAGSRDPRRLGVPIERLVLSGSGLRLELGPDCPLLRDGFHADETSPRWTNGKAAVPADLSAHFAGKIAIDLRAGAIDLCYPILAIEEPVNRDEQSVSAGSVRLDVNPRVGRATGDRRSWSQRSIVGDRNGTACDSGPPG